MGNILVCDDERSICELLDIALRRDGHKVETVTGGEAASGGLGLPGSVGAQRDVAQPAEAVFG